MKFTQILALVRADVRLHMTNRRALIVSVLVPILIASFFGYLFGGANNSSDTGKMKVALVDNDGSAASREIVDRLSHEALLQVETVSEDEARDRVRGGKASVAVVFPKDFAQLATRALFRPSEKPQITLWYDPSQSTSKLIVEGLVAQYGMQVLTKQAFSGAAAHTNFAENLADVDKSTRLSPEQKRSLHDFLSSALKLSDTPPAESDSDSRSPLSEGLSIPYAVNASAMTSSSGEAYNSYAHSFAGMAVQFILFAGIDAGVLLLLTMERGLWQRFRSAPLAKSQLLIAKTLATTLISFVTLFLIYAAAMLIFGVRIQGSVPGFFAVAISFCLLNASFGLLLASIGRTAGTTRGLASMATILLVMLGGAWVPAFIFPKWLQTVSLFVPTRWAIDGFDAMTWRGLGIDAALAPVGVMLGTAAICLLIAVWRMPWSQNR
jgi:ABC-2 type transport system permease protein